MHSVNGLPSNNRKWSLTLCRALKAQFSSLDTSVHVFFLCCFCNISSQNIITEYNEFKLPIMVSIRSYHGDSYCTLQLPAANAIVLVKTVDKV